MSALVDSLAPLDAEPVSDVLVGGYVDRGGDGAARFHPMADSVYLVCGGRMLRFVAGRDDYVVKLDVVTEVTCDFAIDEDDEFCVASLFTLLLGDAYTERRVDRFRAAEAPGGVAWCELTFEDGEVLRIAPMVPSGLRLTTGAEAGGDGEPAGGFSWRRGIGWTGLRPARR